MVTNNLKEIQQIKALIAKGKTAGYLTFEEVSKAVPVEMSSPENLEEIIGMFDQMDIAIVDSEKEGKSITGGNSESEADTVDVVFDAALDTTIEGAIDLTTDMAATEDAGDFAARNTDPVRMYLREMGAVPLLDRDGEVVIAKKIEMGEQDVLYALVEVPVAVEELINVGEDLKQNRIKLKDVVKTIEEDDPSEDEMNQRQRVILLLEEIRAIYKKKRKIYTKLDACCTLERRVAGTQKEILQYKEEVVERLRDIKLEKTLIDRIIETVEDYVRQMRNYERELEAYIQDIKSARGEEELSRSAYHPSINLEVGPNYTDRGGKGSQWTYSFDVMGTVRWNIFNSGADVAETKAARARVRQARQTMYSFVDDLKLEIETTWTQYLSAREQFKHYTDAIGFNTATRDAYEEQFMLGQRSLLDVLDAESELFNSSTQAATARGNILVGAYRLQALAGVLLRGLGIGTPALDTAPAVAPAAPREAW